MAYVPESPAQSDPQFLLAKSGKYTEILYSQMDLPLSKFPEHFILIRQRGDLEKKLAVQDSQLWRISEKETRKNWPLYENLQGQSHLQKWTWIQRSCLDQAVVDPGIFDSGVKI